MKFKVGDKVCYKHPNSDDNVEVGEVGTICGISKVTGNYGVAFETKDTYKHNCGGLCHDNYGWWCSGDTLEPADNIVRMADGTIIGDFSTGGFCDGFRGGKIPNDLIVSHTEMERAMDTLLKALEKPSVKFGIKKLEQKLKEEKNLKFTFYTTDWTNIDKSNGEKIPMRTTYAYVGANKDVRADTACPVAEYDERIGCLIAAAKISADKSSETKMMYNIARNTWGTELSWAILLELADSAFNGNFERAYKKFHNDNVKFEKKRLTCSFCGKVFETVEEKRKHENEHIQRKKDKREKYLIRKEAKRRLAEAEREGKIEKVMKELYKK